MEKNDENTSGQDYVGLGEMVAYGMGGFGRGIFNSIAMTLLNYFYTNSIGMSAAIVGMIFMLSRLLDGVTDISVGVLVDKVKSRHGKARSWLLWSVIPFGVSTFLLFTVPDISYVGKIIYVVITYNLVTSIFGTLFYVPHMTLPALMTRNQTQRTQITIVNQILSAAASFVPSMILLPLILKLGGSQSSWIQVMAFAVPVGIITILICFFFTKERVKESSDQRADDKGAVDKNSTKSKMRIYGALTIIKTLLSNKYWLMVLGIFIFDALSNNFFFASAVYYCQYILGNAGYLGTLSFAFSLPITVGLFAAGPFIKKFSKRDIFLIGAIIKLVGLVAVIILPASLVGMSIARVIAGFGTGITFSTMYAFVPDTMEYGQWKTGIRLEGTLQSACSIGAKFGVGVAPGIVGILMSMARFDGMVAVQPEAALNIIRLCTIWLPALFALLMAITIYFYDLDKKYNQILVDLQERNQ